MISIRLDRSLEDRLQSLAEKKHLSKSKIIKEALAHYFDMTDQELKSKTAYELGNGLFGRYGSEDGSLSTTYKQKLKKKLHAKNSHR